MLWEAAPRVVDKETLFSRVWPDTHVVESSLTRNMSVLRKVLDDEDGSRFIESISKRGYRFVVPISMEPAASSETLVSNLSQLRTLSRHWIRAATIVVCLVVAATLLGLQRMRRSDPPELTESYRQYLIGRHLWNKGTPGEMEKALARFEDATRLNPNDALAHAGKADALIFLASLGARKSRPAAVEAMQSARLAVERRPRFGATHGVLGAAVLFADYDWRAAETEYRRAISLDPRGVRGYFGLSRLLAQTGRLSEAIQAIETAQRLDPVSPLIAVRGAYFTYLAGHLQDAEKQFQTVLEREPDFDPAHYYLGLVYGFLGDVDRSLKHLLRARLSSRTLATDQAWVLARNGKPEEAQRLLLELEGLKRENRISRSAGATLFVVTGSYDQALQAMHHAITDRESWALDIACDPRFKPLHAHPGFAKVLERLDLPSR